MPKKAPKRSKPKTRAASKAKPKRARAKTTRAKVAPKARGAMKVTARMPVWYQPQAVLGSAVRYVSTLSPKFNWVGIYLLKGNSLELGPYIGAKTEHTRIKVGQGVCGTAVATDSDMNVPDVSQSDNYLACSLETQSELVILIRDAQGHVLGQIDIDSHQRGAFGPAEEAAVKKVAQELGTVWPE